MYNLVNSVFLKGVFLYNQAVCNISTNDMTMSSLRKKGQIVHNAAKEIICHVIDVCDEEASTGTVRFPLQQRNMRVSDYTGVSDRTISRIRKECKQAGDSKLRTPGKHRPRTLSTVAHLDYFGMYMVRNIIKDVYLLQKGEITCSKLLETVKEKLDFPWSVYTLRRLLKDIGFKWKRFGKKRQVVLIEHPHISMWRFKYLKSIKKAREQNKNIIYLSETWVDSSLTFKKCWYNVDDMSTYTNVTPSNRLIILHASKETGFIENAQLIFKADEITGDYDGHMSYRTFEKWLTEKLLPNLPQNSVIVLGSSPYNSVEQNKTPSKYSTKATMISWLEKNNVLISPHMFKVELFNLIAKYKSNEKIYYVDELLKVEGHTVLRLPPYMYDLNPIELSWEKIENKIRQKDRAANVSQDLKTTVIEAMNSITADDWKRFYSNVVEIENEYSSTDEAMEVEMEKFIVNIADSESSDSSSDSGSEVYQP